MSLLTSISLVVVLVSTFAITDSHPVDLVELSPVNFNYTDQETANDVIVTEVQYNGNHPNSVYFTTYMPYSSDLIEFSATKNGSTSFVGQHPSNNLPVFDNDIFEDDNQVAMAKVSLTTSGLAKFVTSYRVNHETPKTLNKMFSFLDFSCEDPRHFTTTIESSNFNIRDYPNNSKHVWYLRCQEGYSFNVNVTEFDMEEDLDRIVLISAPPGGDKKLIKEISCRGLTETHTNDLVVTFRSDCDVTARGFRASVTVVEAYHGETATLPETTTAAIPEITIYEVATSKQTSIPLEVTKFEDTSVVPELTTFQDTNFVPEVTTFSKNLGSGRDCRSIKEANPSAESGRYTIEPGIEVVCQMSIEGGGWTTFQAREDGSTSFTQNWWSYANGFGSLEKNFWLGLENVHQLTASGVFDLRIVMQSFDGTEKFAQYRNFKISDSSDNYRLTFDKNSYVGDAGDALYYHRNMQFSTFDRDNDLSTYNCITDKKRGSGGGNWMNSCYRQILNGRYGHPGIIPGHSGNHKMVMGWQPFDNYLPLKSTKMMFRRSS